MLREFVFTKGELVDWGEDYCRTNLKIQVSDVRRFIRQVRGNHHIVVYGDWTNRIKDLCGEFGIETVGI
jgi:L-fucose isomerase-like protein